jgi:hypothetical protein
MKIRIKFLNSGYWNKAEMTSITAAPTPEQLQRVKDYCDRLTAKYADEVECFRHPEQVHAIHVHFHNDYIDFQCGLRDTCGCKKAVERLIEIRNHEWGVWNQKLVVS